MQKTYDTSNTVKPDFSEVLIVHPAVEVPATMNVINQHYYLCSRRFVLKNEFLVNIKSPGWCFTIKCLLKPVLNEVGC